VSFEQGRSEVTVWTGYTDAQVNQVTGAILSDLVFGPPTFDVTLGGKAVLTERERSHMADVRGRASRASAWWRLRRPSCSSRRAWQAAAALVLAGRGDGRHGDDRRGCSSWRGRALLLRRAVRAVHEIFFASGSFMFDPRTDKLVQLFPDDFWSDTTIALAVVVLVLGLAAWKVAGRMAARLDGTAGPPATEAGA